MLGRADPGSASPKYLPDLQARQPGQAQLDDPLLIRGQQRQHRAHVPHVALRDGRVLDGSAVTCHVRHFVDSDVVSLAAVE